MTVSSNRFTPEVLISTPRRSPATPSPSGSYALYTISKYSLESHAETNEIRVLNLVTGIETLFSDDATNKEPNWLLGNQVLWLREVDGGNTELWIGTAGEVEKNTYLAGSVAARIRNVKSKVLANGTIALAFTADSNPDGSLHNAVKAPKPLSSAREYDTSLVRFWDTYLKYERSSLWYTRLKQPSGASQYRISENDPVNALKGTPLECPDWPSDPLSGPGFDISTQGLLVNVRDPRFNPAKLIHGNLWYIPLTDFTEAPAPKPREITVPDYDGSSSSAVFSADGRKVAFLKQKEQDVGDDWNRIFVIPDLRDISQVTQICAAKGKNEGKPWDLDPSSLTWSNNGEELYVAAEEQARGKIFKLPVPNSQGDPITVVPTPISQDGVISSVYPLSTLRSEKRLFVNKTTLTDSSIFALLDPVTGAFFLISSATHNGGALGLHASQVSEISVQSRSDYQLQAWVMVPSNFDPHKTYPLAFLIHGGPQSSWSDSWSTRWNPAIFAEQGYVVVFPNPTGSTGFGQAFTQDIKGDWGGRPYYDLEDCFSYIEKRMSYVDTSRAVALGASYGGYMVNWIAGQPLAKKFKCLVCHDGVFSTYSMLSTDVIAGLPQDMGGDIWQAKSNWDKYDPAQFTQNWTQPMLFIHSDMDYRCPITEGLAPFNVCQARGIESRFLNFPDENHFVLKKENSLKWHRTVLGWINKFAGIEDGVLLEPPASEPHRMTEVSSCYENWSS